MQSKAAIELKYYYANTTLIESTRGARSNSLCVGSRRLSLRSCNLIWSGAGRARIDRARGDRGTGAGQGRGGNHQARVVMATVATLASRFRPSKLNKGYRFSSDFAVPVRVTIVIGESDKVISRYKLDYFTQIWTRSLCFASCQSHCGVVGLAELTDFFW